MKTKSIWQKGVHFPEFAAYLGDQSTRVAIIGGGLTGLLTAHFLRHMNPVVLEANRICSGQTGRTTAKITSQHNLIYADLTARLGMEAAMQYARANEAAIGEYARIIDEGRIDCGFTRCSALLYSRTESTPLREEAEAARALGISARFTQETELPFPIAGAVEFSGQARFHPLKFLRAIAEGLDIHEHTRVLQVEDGCIHTDRGTLRAEHIVFACHYPFVNVPGWHFVRMHQERSYVLALENAWLPENVHLGVDGDGLSLRAAEGLLLVGGGGHRTGENEEGGKLAALRESARTLFPGAREIACWAAQDCVTADGVPCIGLYARSQPRWYVATGYAKWGMTSAMAAARIISGMIMGDTPDDAEVFNPQRPWLAPGNVKPLMNEAGHVLRNLAKTDGAPRCPHMGCAMTWNPDAESWDCPCHGSRFGHDGALLDGPAQTNADINR